MIFKGNNLIKIEELVKDNNHSINEEKISGVASCGKIENCKWYKTQNGAIFKDILILTVSDDNISSIEVHVDDDYVSDLINTLKEVIGEDFSPSSNVSAKHFNGKKIFFEGEIIYFNNRNICIYKNGTVYKESA